MLACATAQLGTGAITTTLATAVAEIYASSSGTPSVTTEAALEAHEKVYSARQSAQMDTDAMRAAAAAQAVKDYVVNEGEPLDQQDSRTVASKLVGFALAEASNIVIARSSTSASAVREEDILKAAGLTALSLVGQGRERALGVLAEEGAEAAQLLSLAATFNQAAPSAANASPASASSDPTCSEATEPRPHPVRMEI